MKIPNYMMDGLKMEVVVSDDFQYINKIPVYSKGQMSAYIDDSGIAHYEISDSDIPEQYRSDAYHVIGGDGSTDQCPVFKNTEFSRSNIKEKQIILNYCPEFSGDELTVNWDIYDSGHLSVYDRDQIGKKISTEYDENGIYTISFSNNVSSLYFQVGSGSNSGGQKNVIEIKTNSINSINCGTMCYSHGLKKVEDHSIRTVDHYFYDCYEITSLHLYELTAITKAYAFNCMYNLKEFIAPKLKIITGVGNPDISTFKGDVSLSGLYLPSLESITSSSGSGGAVFRFTPSLEFFHAPKLKSVSRMCFMNDFNLKDVLLPSLEYTNGQTFDSCITLKDVRLPSLREVKTLDFNQCRSLERITFGNNLQSISSTAFNGCRSLRTMNLVDCDHVVNISLTEALIETFKNTRILVNRNVYDSYVSTSSPWYQLRNNIETTI